MAPLGRAKTAEGYGGLIPGIRLWREFHGLPGRFLHDLPCQLIRIAGPFCHVAHLRTEGTSAL